MSTAVWGNGEAYSLAHAELRGVATIYDPCGALFLPDLHMLVVSDLHLEKGSSFARRGQLIPPYDTAATLDMLAAVIARYQPRTVISLGDSFHDAKASERLPSLYAIRLKSLIDRRDWFWITGNHDPDSPADLPGDCVEELAIGTLTFRHEPSRIEAKGEVAGHLHPAAHRPARTVGSASMFCKRRRKADHACIWCLYRSAQCAGSCVSRAVRRCKPARLYAGAG